MSGREKRRRGCYVPGWRGVKFGRDRGSWRNRILILLLFLIEIWPRYSEMSFSWRSRICFFSEVDKTTEYVLGRNEIGGVSLPTQLEYTLIYTATKFGMVNRVKKGGWECIPHPHQPGLTFISWWNVRQKIGHCHSVCTLWVKQSVLPVLFYARSLCLIIRWVVVPCFPNRISSGIEPIFEKSLFF
jgi:hypothetical protein